MVTPLPWMSSCWLPLGYSSSIDVILLAASQSKDVIVLAASQSMETEPVMITLVLPNHTYILNNHSLYSALQ